MLDAFIIDRIRRERGRQETARIPLRVEIPATDRPERTDQPERSEDPAEPERGSTVIEDAI